MGIYQAVVLWILRCWQFVKLQDHHDDRMHIYHIYQIQCKYTKGEKVIIFMCNSWCHQQRVALPHTLYFVFFVYMTYTQNFFFALSRFFYLVSIVFFYIILPVFFVLSCKHYIFVVSDYCVPSCTLYFAFFFVKLHCILFVYFGL